jgi:hypothetical protein
MIGRPSKFSAKLADAICERIAGGESLRAICKGDDFPDLSTVIRWLADDRYAEFRQHYERAREIQADHFVDEIVEIADTEPDPQIAKVRIDARKWVAGKMRPKKYGEKIDVEHSGNAEKPIVHRIERVIVRRP